jgi:hypothetical protein
MKLILKKINQFKNGKKNITISKLTIKNIFKSFLIGLFITFIHQIIVKNVKYNTEYVYTCKDCENQKYVTKTYLVIHFSNGYYKVEEVISDGSNFAGFVQGIRVVLNCFYSSFYSMIQLLFTSFFVFIILYFFQKFSLKIE